MLCVVAGLVNLAQTKVSFNPANSFSTIVRRTRQIEMEPDIEGEGDARGSAPLPRKLAAATMVMTAISEPGGDSAESPIATKLIEHHTKAPNYIQYRSYEAANWI